jgi:hypothetical protein
MVDLEAFFVDDSSDGSGPDGEACPALPARPMVLSEFGHVGPSGGGGGGGGGGLPRDDRPHGLLFDGGADDRLLSGGDEKWAQ